MIANEPRHRFPWPGARVPDALRDSQRWAQAAWYVRAHNRRLGRAAGALHFSPMRPDGKARISLIAARLGLRIETIIQPGEPTMAWETGTWFDPVAAGRLPADAVNGRCLDISKSQVDLAWAQVAGYSVQVDPLTFEGTLVVKSEINGRHDGRLVQGPIAARRPGFAYQRFVDSVEGDRLVDLRTTVIGTEVPVLWRRYHSSVRWFEPATASPFADADKEFSAAERAQLLQFVALIGLDYGELDVLRDKHSGLLYVLDANRTPQGPADSEPAAAAARATDLMAESLSRLLAERWPARLGARP